MIFIKEKTLPAAAIFLLLLSPACAVETPSATETALSTAAAACVKFSACFDAGYAEKDPGRQAELYTRAINLWGKDDGDKRLAITYADRGITFYRAGEYNKAISDFTSAIGKDPDYAFSYYNRATAYYNKNDFGAAITDLGKAIELGMNYGFSYYLRGTARLARKDYEKAIEDFDKSASLERADAALYRGRGDARYGSKDCAGAVKDYDQALALDAAGDCGTGAPGTAYASRGTALYCLKAYDLAVLEYDKAEKAAPPNAPTLYNRAMAYRKLNETSKAVGDLLRAIKLDPEHSQAYALLGTLHRDLKKYELSLEYYAKALEAGNPRPETVYNNRGISSYCLKAYDAAISDFGQAIAANPAYAKAYANRAMALCQKGNCGEALADGDKAIAADAKYPPAYGVRGYLYFELGKYGLAAADFKKAVELDAQQWDSCLGLALVSSKEGKAGEAAFWLKRAGKANPKLAKGMAYIDELETEGYFYTLGQKKILAGLFTR